MIGYHGIPNHIAPRMIAAIPAAQKAKIQPSNRLDGIDVSLARASTSGNSAAGDSNSRSPAAVSFTPGMACTREPKSEPFFIPSFLHCARTAHVGMKPETPQGVITIENQNIAGTA